MAEWPLSQSEFLRYGHIKQIATNKYYLILLTIACQQINEIANGSFPSIHSNKACDKARDLYIDIDNDRPLYLIDPDVVSADTYTDK